ncbi:hypothetical protein COL63_26435 [Bacillus pseudomycoides]|nr:hypothetical protein COL63_26435 [Bacillus pseudomycoides]
MVSEEKIMKSRKKGLFFKIGATPHTHQAKILKYPQTENFIFLQLFMRIQLTFFVLRNNQFLKLMDVCYYPHF